ncbi:RICIN domain-containing protein [Streptomyces sp. NPDC002845]
MARDDGSGGGEAGAQAGVAGGGTHGDGAHGDGAHGGGTHAAASDARLTELLRADTPTAYPALLELRDRHQPSVLAYARLCTASESAARQLAAQVFTIAARETARGTEPSVPWRHQLLLLTGQSAAAWATDERAAGLDAGLLLVLNTAGPGGPVPPLLTAFQSLPPRAQGLVWYGTVEREPDDRTAVFLGLTREDVSYGREPALQALRQACLRLRLAASDDRRCQDFRRLIEESVRPDNPRHSPDLHAHMAHCAHCAGAYEELTTLRDTPRPALAEGLLPWSGAAYVRDVAPRTRPRTAATAAQSTSPWPPSRRFVLASAALGVALAPLLLLLLSPGDPPPQDTAGSVTTPTAPTTPPNPPSVTATATATVSSSPSPSLSPTPSRSSTPSASPTSKSPPPSGTYAQVVNVSSGLCLDIRGALEKGTDVVTATCTSAATQRWRVDAGRGVLQSYADPEYCLDSRGSTDRGVGIWACSSVEGRNGQNLRFAVDARGVIRPGTAPDHAVTPDATGTVSLRLEEGSAGQRWRAGAA